MEGREEVGCEWNEQRGREKEFTQRRKGRKEGSGGWLRLRRVRGEDDDEERMKRGLGGIEGG
jgi:hypothetical protein